MSEFHQPDGFSDLEDQLARLAEGFPYPKTPDFSSKFLVRPGRTMAGGFRIRRVVVLILILLAVFIVSVPPVRAAVIDFLQIGRIRIFLESDALPGDPPVTATAFNPTPFSSGGISPPVPAVDPAPLQTARGLAQLVGEQTVAAARADFPYPSPLPGYPADLGPPARAFRQDLEGEVLLLVWEQSGPEAGIRLGLMILGPGARAGKSAPQSIVETEVNGARALWLEGDHLLILDTPSGLQPIYLTVEGNVLLWERDGLTFRLEGMFALDEMRRIAESLE